MGEEVFGSVLQSKREIIRGTAMRQKVGRRVDDIRKPKIVHCVHAARAVIVYVDGNDNGQIY